MGKVRESGLGGPNRRKQQLSIRAPTKEVLFFALAVDKIVVICFNTGIDHHNGFEALLLQILDHRSRVGEMILIPGKYPVAIHEVNIQVERIAGNLLLAEGLSQIAY